MKHYGVKDLSYFAIGRTGNDKSKKDGSQALPHDHGVVFICGGG